MLLKHVHADSWTGIAEAISKRDAKILRHLAATEAVRARDELLAVAARDFPDVPHSELAVVIDFARDPPTRSVVSLDTLRTDAETPMAAIVDAVRESALEITLVRFEVRCEDFIATMVTCLEQDLWLRK